MLKLTFDIGGTFTDFAAENTKTGQMSFWKTRSTPLHIEKAVLRGLKELLRNMDGSINKVSYIAHATTTATNAIIERKGSRTGLITTRGFRDILLLGRQKRYETYDLFLEKPKPLIPRRNIKEVSERLDKSGQVLQPLDMDEVEKIVNEMIDEGIESIAVSLLHSYVNPVHEKKIGEWIKQYAPQMFVSLSSEISPKIREYERTSTVVANAYVKPIVTGYFDVLQESLGSEGFDGEFFIMQSNGGLATPELVKKRPIQIVESGPAAGVLMARQIGLDEDIKNIFTFDMGGTTAKLGAIDNGQPAITPIFEVDPISYQKGSGLPLNIPSIELLEIGAGGGSIASIEMGLLKIGPESSGADPGPICYGQGGSQVTVTDANLVLGYLNPNYFNGGQMSLDIDSATKGIEVSIAQPLGISIEKAAWGIHQVTNSNMERAMRIVSIECGRDPRNYSLVAFGGAGPIHAARLAHALNIPRVIIPWGAGVGSAVGLLTAEGRFEVSLTRISVLTPSSSSDIESIYQDLMKQANEEIYSLAGKQNPRWKRYAYMRYKGQGYELKVDLPEREITKDFAETVISAFHEKYHLTYGYRQEETPVEVVDWHLVATLPTGSKPSKIMEGFTQTATYNPTEPSFRQVYFPELDGYVKCKVINRYRMTPGQRIDGPAIIEESESTTVVPPNDAAYINERGHLVICINESKEERQ